MLVTGRDDEARVEPSERLRQSPRIGSQDRCPAGKRFKYDQTETFERTRRDDAEVRGLVTRDKHLVAYATEEADRPADTQTIRFGLKIAAG
jgi:hypothetical protein